MKKKLMGLGIGLIGSISMANVAWAATAPSIEEGIAAAHATVAASRQTVQDDKAAARVKLFEDIVVLYAKADEACQKASYDDFFRPNDAVFPHGLHGPRPGEPSARLCELTTPIATEFAGKQMISVQTAGHLAWAQAIANDGTKDEEKRALWKHLEDSKTTLLDVQKKFQDLQTLSPDQEPMRKQLLDSVNYMILLIEGPVTSDLIHIGG